MVEFLSFGYFFSLVYGLFHFVAGFSLSYPLLTLLLTLALYRLALHLISLPRLDSLDQRYVLVTGCARGFGFDIAKRLDSLGCHVIACCRAERGMSELDKATSDRCLVICMDVSNHESVLKGLEFVKSTLPPGKGLWGLVNNAGTAGTKNGPIDWLTLDDYRQVLEVNLLGAIDVTMTFLPLLKQARGRIINMSSTLALLTAPYAVNYAVSKIAVESFSDGLRRTLRPYGCKVVVLEPGAFKTDLMSKENHDSVLTSAWETLPQETKDNYGTEFCDKYAHALQKTMEVNFGNEVSLVSDAVVTGLFSKHPAARYMVGKDVRFIYSNLAALPEWLSDWLFEKLAAMPQPLDVNKYKQL